MKTTFSAGKWVTEISDDFINPQTALSADGRIGNWFFDEVSAGTASYISVAGRAGVVRLAIATAAASVTNWLGCMGVQITERTLNPVFECEMLGSTDTDHRIIAGFHQIATNTTISADTNQSANEIFFRKQAGRTYYECVTRSASGSENIVELPTVSAGVYHVLKIEVRDLIGTVFFYVDTVLVATVTPAVPTSGTRLTMAVGHGVTSTVARQIDIDYLALKS